ncbi:MAG: helix-turn-helix domain-containing protein [Ilumatobacteraceae bacterium]
MGGIGPRRRLAPLLVTVEQAGEILGLSRTTIYELINRGELQAVHVGRSLRFPVSELERFVETLLAGADGP